MQIRPTHPARPHTQQYLPRFRFRFGELLHAQVCEEKMNLRNGRLRLSFAILSGCLPQASSVYRPASNSIRQRPQNIPADVVCIGVTMSASQHNLPGSNEHSLPSHRSGGLLDASLAKFRHGIGGASCHYHQLSRPSHIVAQRHGAFHNLPPETLSDLDAISTTGRISRRRNTHAAR